ncbi:MAG: hypothetical protein HUK01_00100 [Bacteroidaceae bacterium]|nr:hypothetical protein [Bacteroidaceae bacterium]
MAKLLFPLFFLFSLTVCGQKSFTYMGKTVAFDDPKQAKEYAELIEQHKNMRDVKEQLSSIDVCFDRVFIEFTNIEHELTYSSAILSCSDLEFALSRLSDEIDCIEVKSDTRTAYDDMKEACKNAIDEARRIVSYEDVESYYDCYNYVRACYRAFERIYSPCRQLKGEIEDRMKEMEEKFASVKKKS